MKYALLNNERIEPQKGIKDAICPCCGEIVIPKCGKIKIHHWAHKSKENCDPWWENETEWHRQWKDNFPKECQEVIKYDNKTGEKHVADVKTQTGIVLEFQHSSINPEEQYSREQFYENMIWIVDARKDYNKFKQYIKLLKHCESNEHYFFIRTDFYEKPKDCFPKRWLKSSVPVIFDFGLHDTNDDEYNKQKKWLWCIFPDKYTNNLGYGYSETICGLYLKKDTLIERVSHFNNFFDNIVLQELEEKYIELQKKQMKQKLLKQQKQIKLEQELIKRELIKQQKQMKFEQELVKQEEKWINTISHIKSNIKNNKLSIKKLFVSKNGKILDNDNNEYNGKKCIILGAKSYPVEYNGNEYTKSNVLLLVQGDDRMLTTIIEISSSTCGGSWIDYNDKIDGDFNHYIRTIDVILRYNKFSFCFSENKYKINSIEKLKNDLEYIKNEFSNYPL